MTGLRAPWSGTRRFHFIQDVPTPHNNSLLGVLADVGGLDLVVEYAVRTSPQYSFPVGLADEVRKAHIYGTQFPNLRIMLDAICRPKDRWLLVAWSNPTTRALIIWFWMTRRHFNCWVDVPPPVEGTRAALRRAALWFLRRSRVQIFAVGTKGIEYFRVQGFSDERLHNLPIVFSTTMSLDQEPSNVRVRWGVPDDKVLAVSGSRLTPDKGFDVLIDALQRVSPDIRSKLVTLIVGQGPERGPLESAAQRGGLLGEHVRFLDWLDGGDFAALVRASDFVIHCSRTDSFGGASVVALSQGRPIVGSTGAGSAVDIVTPGVNGWLYDPEDAAQLAVLLTRMVDDERMRALMAMRMASLTETRGPTQVCQKFLHSAW
jgi:glycosyltransferase involved in cell wall biosynthesis